MCLRDKKMKLAVYFGDGATAIPDNIGAQKLVVASVFNSLVPLVWVTLVPFEVGFLIVVLELKHIVVFIAVGGQNRLCILCFRAVLPPVTFRPRSL